MIDLSLAYPYVRLHRDHVMVVKVGGACLAKPKAMQHLAHQLAIIQACGACVVVVHGGGPQTDELQRSLGEEPHMVDGRRVTSPTALRALKMTTAGELNSAFAAAITAEGARAVGMCAGTGNIVLARRRPPVETSEGVIDFGEVGDVESVDVEPLEALLDSDVIPVLCPPASDGEGGFLNVNADVTAASLATALGATKLVLVTGEAGVLLDPEDRNSLASTLTVESLRALDAEGHLKRGMKVKAAAIETALQGGVDRVHVVSGTEPEALLGELYTTHGTGTLITREEEVVPQEVELGAPA